jgi:signal transduction histidine kinase
MAVIINGGETPKIPNKSKVQFSLRWKIAVIFSFLFLAAFLLTLYVVTKQVTQEADNQIKTDLTQALEGAAAGVDIEMLIRLTETGETNAQGFSDDPRYLSLMDWLDTIHTAEPDAWPYLYIPAEQEGHVYLVVDLYAIYDPETSSTFMELYKSNSGYILIGLEEQTYRAVDAPLVATLKKWSKTVEGWNENTDSWLAARLWGLAEWLTDTNIAPKRDFGTYGDQFGRWASGYMPLLNSDGEKVAGIGVDFQADMINEIRAEVQNTIWDSFVISYFVILATIFLTSYKITKPIVTLTDLATEIGENNQRVAILETSGKKNKDEIDVLEAVLLDTYQKLGKANSQLQGLSHQLISDREQYRKELARDLHDNVLSYLSVLSTNQHKELDQESMQENYKQVISRLRATIFSLRSPMMEYGLSMAIEDYFDSFESLADETDYKITVEIPKSEARFDSATETHIFRILQQAFDNAIEHSKASEIKITGQICEAKIEIRIEDDGEGIPEKDNGEIDLDRYESRRKFGMVGMIERASLIGADLDIEVGSNGGTIVRLHWQP